MIRFWIYFNVILKTLAARIIMIRIWIKFKVKFSIIEAKINMIRIGCISKTYSE